MAPHRSGAHASAAAVAAAAVAAAAAAAAAATTAAGAAARESEPERRGANHGAAAATRERRGRPGRRSVPSGKEAGAPGVQGRGGACESGPSGGPPSHQGSCAWKHSDASRKELEGSMHEQSRARLEGAALPKKADTVAAAECLAGNATPTTSSDTAPRCLRSWYQLRSSEYRAAKCSSLRSATRTTAKWYTAKGRPSVRPSTEEPAGATQQTQP
jgi:hypothetical protein